MKSIKLLVGACALLAASTSINAQIVGHYTVEHMMTRNVEVQGLVSYAIYSISCSSNFAPLARLDPQMDNLSLHVNPGEVTDRHGRHGACPYIEFGFPVGTASFYAQPDNTGVLDFSIVNTTKRNFEVICNINQQAELKA